MTTWIFKRPRLLRELYWAMMILSGLIAISLLSIALKSVGAIGLPSGFTFIMFTLGLMSFAGFLLLAYFLNDFNQLFEFVERDLAKEEHNLAKKEPT
jgi:hypothetical protein